MKKSFLIAITLFFAFNFANAQQNIKAFYIGHSLTDYIPDMIYSLSENESETSFNHSFQTIPGSPLRWHWGALERDDYSNNPGAKKFAFYDPEDGLPSGDFTHLVLTESVPRHIEPWGIFETYDYIDSFYLYAIQDNPTIQLYLYEVWHCLLSGTPTGCDDDINSNPFRQRLTDDLPMWESAIDTFNLRNNPTNPIKLIPAGQAMGLLYDKIYNNEVPGITTIEQVFEDDIHANDTVRYMMACVHYATLFERSPVGLTNELFDSWGVAFGDIPENLALILQETAWEAVCNYTPLGIDCGPLSVDKIDKHDISLFPVPADKQITIKFNQNYQEVAIRVVDLMGKELFFTNQVAGSEYVVNTQSYNSGVYIIDITVDNNKVSRKIIIE